MHFYSTTIFLLLLQLWCIRNIVSLGKSKREMGKAKTEKNIKKNFSTKFG